MENREKLERQVKSAVMDWLGQELGRHGKALRLSRLDSEMLDAQVSELVDSIDSALRWQLECEEAGDLA